MKFLWISILFYLIKEDYVQGFECEHFYLDTGRTLTLVSHPDYELHTSSNYGNNMFKCWRVEAPQNVAFSLWTPWFHLEYDENCQNDFMEIRCGDEGGIIGRYCGQRGLTSAPAQTGGNEVVVIFRTDSTLVYRGFYLNIRADPVLGYRWSSCHGYYDYDVYGLWEQYDSTSENPDAVDDDNDYWSGEFDYDQEDEHSSTESWNSIDDDFDDNDSWEKNHENAKLAVQAIIGIVIAVIALVIIILVIIAVIVRCVITRQGRNHFGATGPIVQTFPPNIGQTMGLTTQNAAYPVQQASLIGGYPQPNVSVGYTTPNAPGGGYTPQNAPGGGYTPQNAPGGGYTPQNAPCGGYTPQNAPVGGYTPQNATGGGYTPQKAHGGGNTPQNGYGYPAASINIAQPRGFEPEGAPPEKIQQTPQPNQEIVSQNNATPRSYDNHVYSEIY